MAAKIKKSFNKVLWRENAPGGPRVPRLDCRRRPEAAYFLDLCQWPAVAFGIASPEQARKIVATADKRMTQLEKEYGYRGYAGLTALWPIGEKDLDTYGNDGGRPLGRIRTAASVWR